MPRVKKLKIFCPHTKAMLKCMEEIEKDGENKENKLMFLGNILQGIILQQITQILCSHYLTKGVEIERRLMSALTGILSRNLFKHFRSKVKEKPGLLFEVSLKIAKYMQISNFKKQNKAVKEKFLVGLLKRYFLHENINNVIEWVIGDIEVRREIIIYNFKKLVHNPIYINYFELMINTSDLYEIDVYERYLKTTRVQRLIQMLLTGEIIFETKTKIADRT